MAHRLKMLDSQTLTQLLQQADEISKMLGGLKRSLENRRQHKPPATNH